MDRTENIINAIEKFLLFIWAFSMFYPFMNFIFYLFVGVVLVNFFFLKSRIKRNFSANKIAFLVLGLFVLWNLLSVFYSADLQEGIKRFEKRVPLMLIVIVGSVVDKGAFDFKRVLRYYCYGVLSVIVISVSHGAYYFFKGHYLAVSLVKGFWEINFLNFFEHRLYIGIPLLLGIPLILEQAYFSKTTISKIGWYSSALTSCFLIYSSGSRALILLLVCIIIFYINRILSIKISGKNRALIFMSLFLLGLLVVLNHPRTKLTIDLITKEKAIDKIDSRIVTWEEAFDIIKENPWFGVGLGDSNKALYESYKVNKNLDQFEQRLNVHNQFLQTLLETGVIGLMLLMLFFFFMIRSVSKDKSMYLNSFLAIILISFSIESVLSRNLGVFPIVFWIFLLMCTTDGSMVEAKTSDVNNSIRIVLNLAPALLLLFLFSTSKLRSFDRTKPITYMTSAFHQVPYNKLPLKDKLPSNTKAVSFTKTDDFTLFSGGMFLAPEIFRKELNNGEVILDYGFWCYVSKECNLNEALIYAWDRVGASYVSKYEMNKKGTWQYLKLDDKEFSNSFALGVRIGLPKHVNEIEGDIFFALPSYQIKEIPKTKIHLMQ